MINSEELYNILMFDDFYEFEESSDFILDIIPELRFEFKFDQKNSQHHLDVWKHTLLALSLSKKDFVIRLAILLHDIGKPFSYVDDDEEIRHFPNHSEVSYRLSKIILNRFNYSDDIKRTILTLVKYHDTPITNQMIDENPYICKILLDVQTCNQLAHHPKGLEKSIMYIENTNKKLELER